MSADSQGDFRHLVQRKPTFRIFSVVIYHNRVSAGHRRDTELLYRQYEYAFA